ncbi:MAG: hypothetical protein LH461_07620 [Spirochaetaceae bacterium]|nr:hypothetical protein [Spirochaetaceae bacterium]
MASARYQLFTRFPRAVEWRLISANNRELGRCTEPFLDLGSCTTAVERLREGIDSADEVVAQDPSGRWRWRLSFEDLPVAMSCRAYLRRVECTSTLLQFRKTASGAVLVPRLRTFR